MYVSDDVQVIEDYDQPVFFSASMYWRYDNGVWYQSRYHTRGWVRVSTPPPQIVRIDRPQAYVHYHGRAQANDTRDASPPARQEVQREMKEEKREQKEAQQEEKREMKEEKREQKQEAKQEKQEAKQEAKDAKDDKGDHGKNKKQKR